MKALKKVALTLSCLAVLVSMPACWKDRHERRKDRREDRREHRHGRHEGHHHHGMHRKDEGTERKHHVRRYKNKSKKETRMHNGKKSTKTVTEQESSY